jgi:hypothetical protein
MLEGHAGTHVLQNSFILEMEITRIPHRSSFHADFYVSGAFKKNAVFSILADVRNLS